MFTESRFPVIDVEMFYIKRQEAEETIPTIPTLIRVGFLPSTLCCKDDTFSFFRMGDDLPIYLTEMLNFLSGGEKDVGPTISKLNI